jgi:hypothetical protein
MKEEEKNDIELNEFENIPSESLSQNEEYKLYFNFTEEYLIITVTNILNGEDTKPKIWKKKFSKEELKEKITLEFNSIQDLIEPFKKINEKKEFQISKGKKNIVLYFKEPISCMLIIPKKKKSIKGKFMNGFKNFLICAGTSFAVLVVDLYVQELNYEKKSKAERVYMRFKDWTSKKIEEYMK